MNVNLTLPVLPSTEIDKHNMNALLARQTQDKERIPRDKRSLHERDYREPQHALQCLKVSSKEDQVGVTRCARRMR